MAEPVIPDRGEPWSKTVHWYDPMITAAAGRPLSGADFLRAMRDGVIPPPPIAALTGRVTKPGRRVAYSMAEIVDRLGKVVATATSSCLVKDSRPAR